MNERIQELVKQAGTDVSGKWISTDNVENLVELIVKECACCIENATVTDSAGNKDRIGDSFFWADELKKHFGVK